MSLTCRYVRADYRNRTDDLRITRGTIPSRTPASCTDSTDHRTDGTHRAGTIQGAVPRTVPRPRPCVTPSCSLCVTSLRHSRQDSQHTVDPRLSHAYRGLANCGKARQLKMTLRHEQPVAGTSIRRFGPVRPRGSEPAPVKADGNRGHLSGCSASTAQWELEWRWLCQCQVAPLFSSDPAPWAAVGCGEFSFDLAPGGGGGLMGLSASRMA